jgi:hypothetical protein
MHISSAVSLTFLKADIRFEDAVKPSDEDVPN